MIDPQLRHLLPSSCVVIFCRRRLSSSSVVIWPSRSDDTCPRTRMDPKRLSPTPGATPPPRGRSSPIGLNRARPGSYTVSPRRQPIIDRGGRGSGPPDYQGVSSSQQFRTLGKVKPRPGARQPRAGGILKLSPLWHLAQKLASSPLKTRRPSCTPPSWQLKHPLPLRSRGPRCCRILIVAGCGAG